ncbi:DnaJ subfamily C member 13 [Thelohanellus kitauei]|uniref:DnaJ subfamily C member 13 n=1 Tax=Thelohanellus kitauei TaxID=669202 RepID=A0A0C2IFZ2_THEKT|nr:DnaJ subfamily C member 13 [Thelohanellus kitauei]
MFMEYLIDVGSPLFRLFNDSSPSIVKSIGIIIKTILDECDQEVIEKLQEMALSEGIFPKHLHTSLFTFLAGSNKFNKFLIFNRQMSRQLLGYWVMDNSTIKTLLYRSMVTHLNVQPVGLVNSLYSDEEAPDDAIHVEQEREEVKLEVEV